MSESCKINKEQILAYVNENISVAEMSERMGIEYERVFDFYAELSAGARRTYPIQLLITKPWLEKKLATTPIADICLEAKVSPRILRRWSEKYGLQVKPLLKDVLTEEVLFALFIKESLTDFTIADRYNCSIETVKKLRKQYGITSSERNDEEQIIDIEFFHRLYVEYGFSVKQLALLLNTTDYKINQLIRTFSSEKGTLALEIKNRKKGFIYTGIIKELMNELEPALIFELLKTKTLTEVAELYEIIPPAEPGVETLSKEWLEILLSKMDISEIMKRYHVGHYFLSSLMKEAELKPISPIERLDEKLVRKLYLELHWNDEQISAITGSTVYSVKTFRKNHNIKASDRLSLTDRLPIEEFSRLYLGEGLTVSQIASIYSVSPRRISDLKVIYSKSLPELSSQKPSGVSTERLQFLKKKLQFASMTK